MPSVTEVLDHLTEPELLGWMLRTSPKKRTEIQEEAKRVGSLVDRLVQEDIRDGGYLVPEGDLPVENCLRGWENFKKDHPEFVPSVKDMQKELKDGDIVGHPDFLHDDGSVTDLKCASGIRPKYWIQTAKYFVMNGGKGRSIRVLRLDKTREDGHYEYQTISSLDDIAYHAGLFEAYYQVFEHARKTREMLRQILEEMI